MQSTRAYRGVAAFTSATFRVYSRQEMRNGEIPPARVPSNEWARRVVLMVCSVLVSTTVAELVARRVVGANYRPWLDRVQPSERDLELRSGQTSTNTGVVQTFDKEGFRVEGTVNDGTRPVLFIGDSFTEGYGAPDGTSFVARSCAILHQRGIEAKCLNAGLKRLGTAHELRLMRRLLAQQRIDAIVFQIFPFNDLNDNQEDGGFRLADGRLIETNPPAPPWYVRARVLLSASEETWARSKLAALLANRILNGRSSLTSSDLELERQLLMATIATAQRYQVPLLFAVVGEIRDCVVGNSRSHANDPYPQVRDLVTGLDTPAVDLCTVTTSERHFQSDGHYSPAGNTAVGEALADAIAHLLRSTTTTHSSP